jgi:hypothetical protein
MIFNKVKRCVGPNNAVFWDVSTAVTMANAFWDTTPCDSTRNRHFGGTYRLHVQGKKTLEPFLGLYEEANRDIFDEATAHQ